MAVPATFEGRALAMLERLGATDARVGQPGTFNVRPGSFRLEAIERSEATNALLQLTNAAPYPDDVAALVRPTANNPLCDLLPCDLLEPLGIRCCEQRTTWRDPRILADAVPIRIPQATVYLNPLNARVEGDIRLRVRNRSERGERCTKTDCKCRSTPPPDCDPVDGSATADGEDTHRVVITQLDELLDTVSAAFSGVRPEAEVARDASFTKSGALETIEAILNILTTGTVRVTAEVAVTARVSWRGRDLSRQFDLDTVARLPVDNVAWRW